MVWSGEVRFGLNHLIKNEVRQGLVWPGRVRFG